MNRSKSRLSYFLTQSFFILISGSTCLAQSEWHSGTENRTDGVKYELTVPVDIFGSNTDKNKVCRVNLKSESGINSAKTKKEGPADDERGIVAKLFGVLKSKATGVAGSLPLLSLIKDYEEILGISRLQGNAGGANYGIRKYLQTVYERDPGLLKSAAEFYDEIEVMDAARSSKKIDWDKRPWGPRASLEDACGKNGEPEPGWAWKLALKKTKGDPRRALLIIGLCGHDDTEQLAATLKFSVSNSERTKWLETMKTRASRLRKIHSTAHDQMRSRPEIYFGKGRSKEKIEALIEEAQDDIDSLDYKPEDSELGELEREITCPDSTSIFYLPGSLGQAANISPDVSRSLESHRGPGTPAKYYHVYGSALVTSEMVNRGHSPELVAFLQKFLAWGYRTYRFNTENCAGNTQNGMAMSKEELDAVELIAKTYVGGDKIGPLRIPQTNFQISTPKIPFLRDREKRQFSRPKGWSSERFEKAKSIAESYLADWDWTVEQHSAGARFAIEAYGKKK